jgi:hypothetical protein
MPSKAEREIGFVIRILQYIGWPFSVLFVPLALVTILVSLYTALTDPEAPVGELLIGTFVFCLIAAFFVSHLLVARNLKLRVPSAGKAARILSAFMLLGFPLFTIVGVLCMSKISSNYNEYCEGN